ncbi:hypothetical protein [Gordonia paraffinivorans]|uniref:hypothetical protein n=1 Tax=Gordonia paraffinivorans TaxID=175628 RepID=UPI0014455ACD|nr:hypothetical protein [Gordonia paraffinivorans]
MASLVAETASRLVATTGDDDVAVERRELGRALFGCEALGLHRAPEHVWGTQGLVIELGVYDADDLRLIEDDRAKHDRKTISVLSAELSRSLGGFSRAVSVSARKIQSDDDNWLLAQYDNPPTQIERLDQYVDEGCIHLTRNQLRILARHTRCRVSVDHAEVDKLVGNGVEFDMGEVRDVLFWWTPVVDEWLRDVDMPRGFRQSALGSVASAVVKGERTGTDDVIASFDDWGDIDITADPLVIRTLGPATGGATQDDVKRVLARAGGLLTVHHETCVSRIPTGRSKGKMLDWKTYEPQIVTMEHLIDECRKSDDDPPFDVLLVYRGGGADYTDSDRSHNDDRNQLLNLAQDLAGLGIEVVFGIGHGDASALPKDCDLPIGIYEATTPTAAAEWVLREFVNSRMANSRYDPGQRA